MPELTIRVGGRPYAVACQDGEEHFLQSAAAMVDAEASTLVEQMPNMPESRLLLMSGLMLADKVAAIQESTGADAGTVGALNARIAELEAALELAQAASAAQEIVPTLPDGVKDQMSELAARAEAVADRLDEKLARDAD